MLHRVRSSFDECLTSLRFSSMDNNDLIVAFWPSEASPCPAISAEWVSYLRPVLYFGVFPSRDSHSSTVELIVDFCEFIGLIIIVA